MYQALLPGVDGLFMCLLVFNVPFTFFKGAVDAALTFLIYKRISPVIKGT
jgi:riboflavin transporter FmnP